MNRQENARTHYRVVYPALARPRFREYGLGAEHWVIDASERGLRYISARTPLPRSGTRVVGTVEFPDGSEIRIDGVVVRVVADEIAVHLDESPIPFTRIIQQQRFLRLNFPLSEIIGRT